VLACVLVIAPVTDDPFCEAERIFRGERLPGLAVGVVDGRTRVRTFGVADLRSGRALGPHTPFYVGSLSKPLTAIAILQLRDAGRLDLDDAVSDHVEVALDVTLAELLTHTAGLPREAADYWWTARFPTRAEVRSALDGATLEGRGAHRYSSAGYALLGQVVERASGTSYADYLESHVLGRLGMSHSGVGRVSDLAMGYSPRGALAGPPGRPFAGLGVAVGARRERLYHDAAGMAPAFGVRSTIADLTRLLRFFLERDGRVLGRRSWGQMRTAQTAGWSWGLKVMDVDGERVLRHNGWFAAHRSHLSFAPDRGVGVVAFGNADDFDPAVQGMRILRAAL